MKKQAEILGQKILKLWVQPRASRNEVVGFQGDILRIRVTAPPAEGEANRLCCRLLAEALRIAPSRIEIVSGHASRKKKVRVQDAGDASWNNLGKK